MFIQFSVKRYTAKEAINMGQIISGLDPIPIIVKATHRNKKQL
jgi:hypothetical protein